MRRLAVVLFNLGGPDLLDAVRPFLVNLFSDPAILGLPWPMRPLLGRLIAARRAKVARGIYAKIGGRSPLVEQSEAQASALQDALAARLMGVDVRAFLAMRYWHPSSDAAAAAVKAFAPDAVVLLPLYPQYSITTTGSSLVAWTRAASVVGLDVPTSAICCYPEHPGFVGAVAVLIKRVLDEQVVAAPMRVLFSAHGLPKKVIAAGDPYQWQVERTAAAVAANVARPHLETAVCYQSRVGPLSWIGPSIEEALMGCAEDGCAAVVVPIAFVSEHSETLVELDIEYRERAERLGVPAYLRVPTVGTHPMFITGLADLVTDALGRNTSGITNQTIVGARSCPGFFVKCPCQ